MGKGSQTQKTQQTNEPPSWAKPLFTQAATDAQNLYNSKTGYNVYTGPTQANFSPQRLEGLNRAMTMTGSKSPPITNDSIYNTDQIQQIRGMIAQQQQQRAAQAAAAAAAKQAPQQQQAGGIVPVTDRSGVTQFFSANDPQLQRYMQASGAKPGQPIRINKW